MDSSTHQKIANSLSQARVGAKPIVQISGTEKDWNQQDAYSIQEMGIRFREENGETLIGMKMGLTSEAKRKQMDLDSPLYGALTDKMKVENGGTFSMKGSIHPKIEPEVAFRITKELKGKLTREEVMAACDGVCCALEILDSRYTEFKYFSMEDVISDNSSSSHFILGEWLDPSVDVRNLKMEMKVNGIMGHEGNSNAISDDPAISIIQLAELLEKRNLAIPAGSIVLAGAATAAVMLEPGMNVELTVENLKNCSVSVSE